MLSNNKFWDVDDLLMTNETLSSIVDSDILGLDINDKTGLFYNKDKVIKEGNKLDAPLWLLLILQNAKYVSIKQPKYLTDKFYHQLQADPLIINFKTKSAFLYDIAMNLIPFLDDDSKWPKCLAEVVYKRFLYLLKNSTNVIYENQGLMKNLAWKEKNFYDKAVKINKNVRFFLENYDNNNKSLDDMIEAKKMNQKRKK